MLKVFLSLVCIISFTISSLANNEDGKASISGTVTTADGQPAISVTVLIKGSNRGTTTDDNGCFEFRKLKAGNYILQISLTGYETTEETITIAENEKATLSFQLKISDKQLYEVIVTGGKNKFAKKESNYVARMPLSNLENPQVYNVVTKELLQEQVNTDFRSTFKNIPGVSANGANHSSNAQDGALALP